MSAASGQKTISGCAALEGLAREPQVGVERAGRAAVLPARGRPEIRLRQCHRRAAALRDAGSAAQRQRAEAAARRRRRAPPRRVPHAARRPTRRRRARSRTASATAAFAQASVNEMPYTPVTDAICTTRVDAGLGVAEGRPRRVADVDRCSVQQPAPQQVGAGPRGAGQERRGGAAEAADQRRVDRGEGHVVRRRHRQRDEQEEREADRERLVEVARDGARHPGPDAPADDEAEPGPERRGAAASDASRSTSRNGTSATHASTWIRAGGKASAYTAPDSAVSGARARASLVAAMFPTFDGLAR